MRIDNKLNSLSIKRGKRILSDESHLIYIDKQFNMNLLDSRKDKDIMNL